MNKILRITLILAGVIIAGATIMFVTLTNNMKEINAIEIHELSQENLEDGEYIGKYYYEEQIGVTVKVNVQNKLIVKIEFIEHIAGLGHKAEIIVEDIIEKQSLHVDDITGATTSSRVIKLAIENALEGK